MMGVNDNISWQLPMAAPISWNPWATQVMWAAQMSMYNGMLVPNLSSAKDLPGMKEVQNTSAVSRDKVPDINVKNTTIIGTHGILRTFETTIIVAGASCGQPYISISSKTIFRKVP